MKSSEILRAIYNDKEVLKKVRKSVDDYAMNIVSMKQIKNDAKEIEVYVKDTYGLPPSIFKKIVKSSLIINDPTDEVIDELSLIREIAQSE